MKGFRDYEAIGAANQASNSRRLWSKTDDPSTAAVGMKLNGRARNGSVSAENTAIARPGLQHFPALRTFPEMLTGVGRHGFCGFVTTSGAGNGRFQFSLGDGLHAAHDRIPNTAQSSWV